MDYYIFPVHMCIVYMHALGDISRKVVLAVFGHLVAI